MWITATTNYSSLTSVVVCAIYIYGEKRKIIHGGTSVIHRVGLENLGETDLDDSPSINANYTFLHNHAAGRRSCHI